MTEIIFIVEDALEGGFTAKAVGESIFTEADTMDEIRKNVKEAVECHFEVETIPKLIRLHMVKEEIISTLNLSEHHIK
jgi:predicted RNase H-like HicB family nuclease